MTSSLPIIFYPADIKMWWIQEKTEPPIKWFPSLTCLTCRCMFTGNSVTVFAQPALTTLHVPKHLICIYSKWHGIKCLQIQVFCMFWKSRYSCNGNSSQSLEKEMQFDEKQETQAGIHRYPQPFQQCNIKSTRHIPKAELLSLYSGDGGGNIIPVLNIHQLFSGMTAPRYAFPS